MQYSEFAYFELLSINVYIFCSIRVFPYIFFVSFYYIYHCIILLTIILIKRFINLFILIFKFDIHFKIINIYIPFSELIYLLKLVLSF